jgi:hypothetical protein
LRLLIEAGRLSIECRAPFLIGSGSGLRVSGFEFDVVWHVSMAAFRRTHAIRGKVMMV